MADSTTTGTVETPETTPTESDGTKSEAEGGTPPVTFADFEAFIAEQPEDIKKLYEEDTKGLKNALAGEREKATDLAKQLRDAAKGADEATATKLNEMAAAQETLQKQAAFYEAASSQGCNNLRLAWIAAQDVEAFDKQGSPDLATLKSKFPELFSRPTPPPKTSAGSGTSTQPESVNMDDFIRRAAGRTV